MWNEAFGWLWMGMGVLSGAVMGLFFSRPEWLGGYGSWERRLLRLGHISFFGLGLLNVLFALSRERVMLPRVWVDAGAWAMVAGGVLMPLCCSLAAWRKRTVALFALPVAAIGLGVTVAWVGLARRAIELAGGV